MKRRLAKYSVTPDVLLCIGQGTFTVTENNLPHDAKIIKCFYDPARRCFSIILEHESFAEVSEDCEIPDLQPPIIQQA